MKLSPSISTSRIRSLQSVSVKFRLIFTLSQERQLKLCMNLKYKVKKSSALKSSLYSVSSFNVEYASCKNSTPFDISLLLKYEVTFNRFLVD